MDVTSRNFNGLFRKVKINNESFLVWFGFYYLDLTKSYLFVERYVGSIRGRTSKNFVVDIPYHGMKITERYKHFNKNIETMVSKAVSCYNEIKEPV